MLPIDALQILLIAHASDTDRGDFPHLRDFVESVRMAFHGDEPDKAIRDLYLADGASTAAAVRVFYADSSGTPPVLPPEGDELTAALHSLVVVFVSRGLVADDQCVIRLEALASTLACSGGRHEMMIVGLSDEVLRQLREHPLASALRSRQGMNVEKLGEYALRPSYTALWTLARAHRMLLAAGASRSTQKARFFISHTKLGGLPLAYSLSEIVNTLPWLESFYDARDIEPGEDFIRALEEGVRDSMLLVLRTDVYDHRLWCRREVMWAEFYDRPVLLVDARAQLFNRPSMLGFIGIPGVRIPDGNLVRILGEGLREWVRIDILRRRFEDVLEHRPELKQRTELICRPPSVTSLVGARERLRAKTAPSDAQIVHAEPALESVYADATRNLVRSWFPDGAVLPFKTFLAELA